jgi:hypothetical protein
MYDDVVNELKSKYRGFKYHINYMYTQQKNDRILNGNVLLTAEKPRNYNSIFYDYIYNLCCSKKGMSIEQSNTYYEIKYNVLDCINHFYNYEYDNKTRKFFRNNEINRHLGGGTSLCGFYSKFITNGVNPKLTNKIFRANGLNFGMMEIIING